jgi:hypothetical protein
VAQAVPLATTFARFVDARPVPVTWTVQSTVIVQLSVVVTGPFKVKLPSWNL